MKLALGLEVYNKAVLDLPIEAIETAERYGYHLPKSSDNSKTTTS